MAANASVPKVRSTPERAPSMRSVSDHFIIKMIDKLPRRIKGHAVAFAGELAGTFLFMLFGQGALNSVNDAPRVGENASQNLASDSSKLLFISLAFGFSLAINAWIFFRVSGGLFNPAVTLGMCLIGAMPVVRGITIFVAQIVGGIAAAAAVYGLTPGPLKTRTQLGGGTSVVQGLFIEMFLTTLLVFTVFMLAAEKHAANFIAPIGIGLALFVAQMFGTYFTGSSLNPTRSFGPAVVTGEFSYYHWIYWVGPGLGALLATAFYKLIKILEYETVNMEKDVVEVASRHYDLATGTEKLVTQDGRVINICGGPNENIMGRTSSDVSGRTEVAATNSTETGYDLEAQKETPTQSRS